MRLCRVIIAKSEVLLLEVGERMIEYGDIPDRFYRECQESPTGNGLDIKILEKKGGVEKYFDFGEEIPFEDTVRGQFVKHQLSEQIKAATQRKSQIEEEMGNQLVSLAEQINGLEQTLIDLFGTKNTSDPIDCTEKEKEPEPIYYGSTQTGTSTAGWVAY